MTFERLIWKEPWLSPVAMNIQNIYPTKSIDTIGITADGKSLYYNPKYWNKLDSNEKLAVQIHEMMHIVGLHGKRCNGRIHEIWNIACDMEINYLISSSGYFLPKRMIKGVNESAENLYDLLLKQHVSIKSGSYKGVKIKEKTMPKYPMQNDLMEIGNFVDDSLQDAIDNALKLCGDCDSSLAKSYKPKLSHTDWKTVLQNLIKSVVGDDLDYLSYEFDEFGICEDILSPKPYSKICVLVDESGSVDDALYSQFLGELHKMERFAEISISGFSNNTSLKLLPLKGYQRTHRGGTCVLHPYKEATELDFNCIIVLTDGYLTFPQKEPTETIWVMPQSFGRRKEVII